MDKYDEQIKFLKLNPKRINGEWSNGRGLFEFLQIPRSCYLDRALNNVGCLTMIRGGKHNVSINGVINKELTKQIQQDKRIPSNANDITIESLPVFAEWQRKLDALELSLQNT